jgi:hypothetical protein
LECPLLTTPDGFEELQNGKNLCLSQLPPEGRHPALGELGAIQDDLNQEVIAMMPGVTRGAL